MTADFLPLFCVPAYAAVNMPGYYYQLDTDGTPHAIPCPADHYCPGLRKQRAAAPCYPGYSTGGLTAMSASSACGRLAWCFF